MRPVKWIGWIVGVLWVKLQTVGAWAAFGAGWLAMALRPIYPAVRLLGKIIHGVMRFTIFFVDEILPAMFVILYVTLPHNRYPWLDFFLKIAIGWSIGTFFAKQSIMMRYVRELAVEAQMRGMFMAHAALSRQREAMGPLDPRMAVDPREEPRGTQQL